MTTNLRLQLLLLLLRTNDHPTPTEQIEKHAQTRSGCNDAGNRARTEDGGLILTTTTLLRVKVTSG
jgi:hypothetical protein